MCWNSDVLFLAVRFPGADAVSALQRNHDAGREGVSAPRPRRVRKWQRHLTVGDCDYGRRLGLVHRLVSHRLSARQPDGLSLWVRSVDARWVDPDVLRVGTGFDLYPNA